jgi:hypothetical protein
MTRTIFTAAALALAATLPIAPAQAAGVGRTFLSAAGSDSNNCANVVTPCRHLATAFAATAQDGEIYVLDPANYGSLTITHGVSIEGHGWASIAPIINGNAITINANTGDKINIIGVVLDGTALSGTTGIQFNSGGTLTVRDSVVRNFGGDGIDFKPTGGGNLWVSNTVVFDNGSAGIAVFPTDNQGATVNINRVETNNNVNYGVFLWGTPSTGGDITATVSESSASGNRYGFAAITDSSHSATWLSLFHCVASYNSQALNADGGGAIITVAQSMVNGNFSNWYIQNDAIVRSYGDNYFDDRALNLGSLTNYNGNKQ